LASPFFDGSDAGPAPKRVRPLFRVAIASAASEERTRPLPKTKEKGEENGPAHRETRPAFGHARAGVARNGFAALHFVTAQGCASPLISLAMDRRNGVAMGATSETEVQEND
jgi:hypothetical protein